MNRGIGYGAALAIWLALSALAYFFFQSQERPAVAVLASAGGGGQIVIPRSRDGHYYVEGAINGHPVTFMVDTGASVVSIGQGMARAAGLPRGAAARFQTAGGDVSGEIVTGVTIEVAGIRIEGLRVAVGPELGAGSTALLGQNFLRRVEVVQQGDRMTLRTGT
jgi:aspartyl protease family protein